MRRKKDGWMSPKQAARETPNTSGRQAGAVSPAKEKARQQAILADRREQRRARRTAARRAARSVTYRYRHQLAPMWVLSGLFALGAAAHHMPAGAVAVMSVGLVVGSLWRLRGALSRPAERAYTAVCLVVAIGWVSFAAWHGVAGRVPAVFTIGGAVLAWPWWRHHRMRPGQAPPAPDTGGDLAEMWEQRVAAPNRALPGSTLGAQQEVPNGTSATIRLAPGVHTTADAVSVTRKISSALEQPNGSVIIEPTPAGDDHLARMLVLRTNPLHRTVPWPGPELDPETGLAGCGVYADGAQARCRWFEPGSGAKSWLVAGAPGSGKSRFLDMALATSAWSGIVHTWLGDGQHGQSIPDWIDSPGIGWLAASDEEIVRMVDAALRVMKTRSIHLARLRWTDDKGRARKGVKHFDPRMTGMPFLQIVIDEAGFLLGRHPELIKPLKELAQAGRKNGIRIVLATQVPSVQELGGSVELRSMISGNVVCFKTNDRVSGGMAFAGGLDVDPSSLPTETPDGDPLSGVCYLLGPGARPSMLRTYFLDDPYEWASTAPETPLHEVDARAAGEDYRTWRDRVEDEDSDTDAPDPAVDRALAAVADGGTHAAESEVQAAGAATMRDLILDLDWAGYDGRMERAQILAELPPDTNVSTAQKALKKLVAERVLAQPAHGTYSRVEQAATWDAA